jgi:hypothetical protein
MLGTSHWLIRLMAMTMSFRHSQLFPLAYLVALRAMLPRLFIVIVIIIFIIFNIIIIIIIFSIISIVSFRIINNDISIVIVIVVVDCTIHSR